MLSTAQQQHRFLVPSLCVCSDLQDVLTAIDLSKKTFNRIRLNYV